MKHIIITEVIFTDYQTLKILIFKASLYFKIFSKTRLKKKNKNFKV